MTAARKRTPKKMSLDRGFVPTKRQREIEKAFFKGGGRHPFQCDSIQELPCKTRSIVRDSDPYNTLHAATIPLPPHG